MDTLQFIWFILFFLLLIGYAILDGFDLGLGIISLFVRKREDRDTLISTVAPFWDGNEIWLIAAGAALFVAFPPVYAILSSAFYVPFVIWLLAMIARAVSIEFRYTVHGPLWQRTLDVTFGLGSLIPALLLGVVLANVLRGLPVNGEGVYQGSFLSLLNPYSLLGGFLSLATFTLHGAAFGATRTRGDLQNTMRQYVSCTWVIMAVLWSCLTVYTVFEARYLYDNIFKNAVFDGLSMLFLISILVITISSSAEKDRHTFLASSVAITCMLGMAGACLFPRMIPSSVDLLNSLTLAKDSPTPRALKIMLAVVLTGIPLALMCHVVIDRRFKGKPRPFEEY